MEEAYGEHKNRFTRAYSQKKKNKARGNCACGRLNSLLYLNTKLISISSSGAMLGKCVKMRKSFRKRACPTHNHNSIQCSKDIHNSMENNIHNKQSLSILTRSPPVTWSQIALISTWLPQSPRFRASARSFANCCRSYNCSIPSNLHIMN